MSFYMHERRDNAKWIIAFILIGVLLVGMVVMAVKLADNETTQAVSPLAFEIGGLGTDGKEINNTGCIRMKNSVSVDGLEIVIAEDAEIKYSVFFYSVDEDGKEVFISKTDVLEADLVASLIPETAEVCKVVIEPTMDAEVGIFEIVGYAQQLEISYNK